MCIRDRGRAGQARLVDAGVELRHRARIAEVAGGIARVVPHVHLVPLLEVGNPFAEVLLEEVEAFPLVGLVAFALIRADGVFLAVENHRHAVNGGEHRVARGGGPRVAEGHRLVVARQVQQDDPIAVELSLIHI